MYCEPPIFVVKNQLYCCVGVGAPRPNTLWLRCGEQDSECFGDRWGTRWSSSSQGKWLFVDPNTQQRKHVKFKTVKKEGGHRGQCIPRMWRHKEMSLCTIHVLAEHSGPSLW